jgi:hypothetical protein
MMISLLNAIPSWLCHPLMSGRLQALAARRVASLAALAEFSPPSYLDRVGKSVPRIRLFPGPTPVEPWTGFAAVAQEFGSTEQGIRWYIKVIGFPSLCLGRTGLAHGVLAAGRHDGVNPRREQGPQARV